MAYIQTHSAAPRAGLQNRKRFSLLSILRGLITLRQSRIALSKLTDSQLADIGVTPHEAQAEAGRPVWDVPQDWRL